MSASRWALGWGLFFLQTRLGILTVLAPGNLDAKLVQVFKGKCNGKRHPPRLTREGG